MHKLLLLALLLALPAAATDVYRWVDEQGQAHYSDQWQPGAERIRVQESSRYAAPAVPERRAAERAPTPAVVRYEALEITSPQHEQVLWNIGGQLHVSLEVRPALAEGHAIRLLLDGTAHDLPAGTTVIEISEVYRGIHVLSAQVIDAQGSVLISSETSTIMVHQTSIAAPGTAGN